MLARNYRRTRLITALLMAVAIFITPLAALAQETRVIAPKNSYSPNDDVKLGRQAAAQVERQLPILHNQEVTDYVTRVGQRLAAAIPPEFQHPEFRYTFQVVNASDINAFALPGGPMFVNRGMIEAAHTEGEMAGVMAHEMSHVALRHGTAQQTKARKYQYGELLGVLAGAVIGGAGGAAIAQGTQLGVGASLLKFSREYEKQADILGSHIMARAGYDPRDLANMFRTIEQQSGNGGPQWLSDHPNPGNRYEYIMHEAQYLHIAQPPVQDTAEFRGIQELLRGMPRARSTAEIQRSGQRYPQGGGRYPQRDDGYPQDSRIGERVEYPSARYQTFNGDFFRISVPDNWRTLQNGGNTLTFAPNGAYDNQGQFTHGVLVGAANIPSRSLQQATDAYINDLVQRNPDMRRQGDYQQGTIAGRNALAVILSNTNEVTRQPETVTVYTTMLRNGNLFYMVAVSPQSEYRSYLRTFQNILTSIQFND